MPETCHAQQNLLWHLDCHLEMTSTMAVTGTDAGHQDAAAAGMLNNKLRSDPEIVDGYAEKRKNNTIAVYWRELTYH